MLKRNLIAIAIVTLGLGITSAFGQAADWEIKPAVRNSTATIKKSTPVKGRTKTVDNNKHKTKSNPPSKMGNFEIQGISETNKILDVKNSPRDTATGQTTGIQSAREAGSGLATGIRRYSKNLGDTGTHEVGHKQRRRGN